MADIVGDYIDALDGGELAAVRRAPRRGRATPAPAGSPKRYHITNDLARQPSRFIPRLKAVVSTTRNQMSTEQDLGFLLPEIEIETSTPPDRRRACFRARKVLEGIVYDTVALEGNPFTFPEVQTLMEGITVGGHKIRDAEQVLNQAESWKVAIHEAETGKFVPLKDGLQSALRLHALVSKDEALEWGKLRTGEVGIAGTEYQPPKAENLEDIYRQGAHALKNIGNTHMRAMATFLFTARSQLFWDGNKRTGRLMMNCELLAAGHDAITVPARKREEFNAKMIEFHDTADASEMVHFLSGCSMDRGLTTRRRNPAPIGERQDEPAAQPDTASKVRTENTQTQSRGQHKR